MVNAAFGRGVSPLNDNPKLTGGFYDSQSTGKNPLCPLRKPDPPSLSGEDDGASSQIMSHTNVGYGEEVSFFSKAALINRQHLLAVQNSGRSVRFRTLHPIERRHHNFVLASRRCGLVTTSRGM
jgi:hypothetical protein